ncbi:MAG: hypothetical protein PHQ11_05565 [Paludibacter sp.]|nr:hypothetical protein [Paludibacter sp.]MDD4426827.1 hypothetical protein [Paludibacter sp.]
MKNSHLILGVITTILIISAISGCTNKNEKKVDVPVNKISSKIDEEIENFDAFHDKFFGDSIFQISRIDFPLPGEVSDFIYGDDESFEMENDEYFIKNNKLFWKKSGWRFLQEIKNENDEFEISIEKVGSNLREHIRLKGTDWIIVYEYALINKKWMLVYYANVCY